MINWKNLTDRINKYGGLKGQLQLALMSKLFGDNIIKKHLSLGALAGREDFGIPQGSTGQYIPTRRIWENYDGAIPLSTIQKLAGIFMYPSRMKSFGVPEDYLEGHETAHANTWNPFANAFVQGEGNKGYFLSPNMKSRQPEYTPTGLEQFVSLYPPSERANERLASRRGMEWLTSDWKDNLLSGGF